MADATIKISASVDAASVTDAHKAIQKYFKRFPVRISFSGAEQDYAKAGAQAAKALEDAANNGTAGLDKLNEGTENLKKGIISSGSAADTFKDKLKGLFTQKWDDKIISAGLDALKKAMAQMWTNVKEIDSALNSLKAVSGASSDTMKLFGDDCANAAHNVGMSVTQIISSAESCAKAGYSLKEALTLSETSGAFANVAAISQEDASAGITSVMKSYEMDASDAEHISDVLTEVGRQYSVSASGLAEALTISGDALSKSNTSFEKSVALLAAGNAEVHDAKEVGKKHCRAA